MFSPESSMVQATLSSHQGWVVSVIWRPDSDHQLLSGSYDGSLKLWDVRSGKSPLYTITAHTGKVLCADWSLAKVCTCIHSNTVQTQKRKRNRYSL